MIFIPKKSVLKFSPPNPFFFFGDLPNFIPFCVFMMNTSVNATTSYTPFELMFGLKANTPISVCKSPEVVYNYNDYYFELKFKLQNAYISREIYHLIVGNMKK